MGSLLKINNIDGFPYINIGDPVGWKVFTFSCITFCPTFDLTTILFLITSCDFLGAAL